MPCRGPWEIMGNNNIAHRHRHTETQSTQRQSRRQTRVDASHFNDGADVACCPDVALVAIALVAAAPVSSSAPLCQPCLVLPAPVLFSAASPGPLSLSLSLWQFDFNFDFVVVDYVPQRLLLPLLCLFECFPQSFD